MIRKKRSQYPFCGRCGHYFEPYKRIYNNPCIYCKPCQWKEYRRYVLELERIKIEIAASLSPTNLEKWGRMNSQEKKLFIFRAMEKGFIEWKVKGSDLVNIYPQKWYGDKIK
jgi:hypothetical protein